jgi:hypothetical protein
MLTDLKKATCTKTNCTTYQNKRDMLMVSALGKITAQEY